MCLGLNVLLAIHFTHTTQGYFNVVEVLQPLYQWCDPDEN